MTSTECLDLDHRQKALPMVVARRAHGDARCSALPEWVDDGPITITFQAASRADRSTSAVLLRVVKSGDVVLAASQVVEVEHPDEPSAVRTMEWLETQRSASAHLGRVASVLGEDFAAAFILTKVADDAEEAEERARREAARIAAEREARLKKARKDARIESYLHDRGDGFGLNLQRGGAKKPLWIIQFRERWERERFRDWFRCQRHRFEEFAAFLEAKEGIDLERRLLAEMLACEKRVKSEGLSPGGRRPLRFWRGDPA